MIKIYTSATDTTKYPYGGICPGSLQFHHPVDATSPNGAYVVYVRDVSGKIAVLKFYDSMETQYRYWFHPI